MTSSLTKISTARRVERSRIWLEGQRLLDHGFTHGKAYVVYWQGKHGIELVALEGSLSPNGERVRHVAGTPHRPIIDITGKDVRETFGMNPYVAVTFGQDLIIVKPTTETKG